MRPSGRARDEMREVRLTRAYTRHAEGSVLVEFGQTRVICNATFDASVPRFLKGEGKGWVTAEYGMLPRSTDKRMRREAGQNKQSGRTHEIQRLIGRSLRAVVDLNALGENTIIIDCDVIQADGGTRTASITGAYVALVDAVHRVLEEGGHPDKSDYWRGCIRIGRYLRRRTAAGPGLRRGLYCRNRHERRHERPR